MGNSYTDFRGFYFLARDAHLEVWLGSLAYEIDKIRSLPLWLSEAQDLWRTYSAGNWGGCIHPGLDEIITDDGRRKVIQSISRTALEALLAEGEMISRDYLKDRNLLENFNPPLPAERFVQVGRRWLMLLDESPIVEAGDAWDRVQYSDDLKP